MFGSFLPSLQSSINHSLLGSRSRHCYAITDNISRHAATLFTDRIACTDAIAHPQHGHHRTTSCTTCSVRSPGRCTPQRQARCPDTTALGRRSRLPLLPSQHLVPPFYSRWVAHPKCEGTCPVCVNGSYRVASS